MKAGTRIVRPLGRNAYPREVYSDEECASLNARRSSTCRSARSLRHAITLPVLVELYDENIARSIYRYDYYDVPIHVT